MPTVREIWLVHHTHVDIGYTEPQSVILRKHTDFIAQALDDCSATDHLPAGERFCWTCEGAWTVKAFLARYPHRRDEFFRRVRERRIEITALYFQLTDLFTRDLLERTTDYAVNLVRSEGVELVTAMNDDVNGWAWGLADILAERGVRYLDVGINETRALGVRPKPSLFRWIGPKGGGVWVWHSDGYMCGNGLDLDGAGGPGRVADYVKYLEGEEYPFEAVQVHIQGRAHDNAPPGLWLCEMIRNWNAKPDRPHLRLCTSREWMEFAIANWPKPVKEWQAGWPDWWADGNGTAAYEVAAVRTAQADLATADTLARVTGRRPSAEQVDRVVEAAAFFCEHTWGAWCSTDDPESLESSAQWNAKSQYAYVAAVEARTLLQEGLAVEAQRPAEEGPGLLVFNPGDHSRNDLVEVTVGDAAIGLPSEACVMAPIREKEGAAFHLEDVVTGQTIMVERRPTIVNSARQSGQKVRFVAPSVPAHGFRRYRVQPGDGPAVAGTLLAGNTLRGSHYHVRFDEEGGGLASIFDRRKSRELVRSGMGFNLGQVIYESIPGPYGREKLCGWKGIRTHCPLERTRTRFAAPEVFTRPYGVGARVRAVDLPGSLRELSLEIMLYDDLPRVDLLYHMNKIPNADAEALYVAFPLAAGESPRVRLEIPGGWMQPGIEQIPGSATDWHSVQHGFAVEGGGVCAVVASPDVPLVQINGINTGKWQESLPPHNGLVMSWVFNNYWFTNFPAAQGGGFSWRYSLSAMSAPFDVELANRFLCDIRQPLVAAVRVRRGGERVQGSGFRHGLGGEILNPES
jgi:alpha-mannosidase